MMNQLRFILGLLIIISVSCCKKSTTGSFSNEIKNEIQVSAFFIRHETFPCEEFLLALEHVNEWKIAILWDTVSDSNSCLNKLIDNPKLKSLQINLINEVGQRNGRTQPNEFLYGISEYEFEQGLKTNDNKLKFQIDQYFAEVNTLIVHKLAEKNIRCLVSPSLESNLTNESAIENLLWLAKINFGWYCDIVWNPLEPTHLPNHADYIEFHGHQSVIFGPCVRNLDGLDIKFPNENASFLPSINSEDMPAWLRLGQSCEINYLWARESNCLSASGWTQPSQRTCESNRWQQIADLAILR